MSIIIEDYSIQTQDVWNDNFVVKFILIRKVINIVMNIKFPNLILKLMKILRTEENYEKTIWDF